VYGESIAAERTSLRNFAAFRFSRLYPLHFATLCATAILVYVFHAQTGRFPVYPFNGLRDFILNTLFIQNGLVDRGYTFNGPAWSLSIEALMYGLFFAFARCGRQKTRWAFFAIAAGAAMLLSGRTRIVLPLLMSSEVARGLAGFFIGVLIYRLGNRFVPVLLGLCCLGAYSAVVLPPGYPYIICWAAASALLLTVQNIRLLRRALEVPALVRLGDLSLGVYLLHFPLQVAILTGCRALGFPVPIGSSAFMLSYTLLLLLSASWIHTHFELPMQRWLRASIVTQRRDSLLLRRVA
jgi:peptidoglycan/LPS O-acetylase OafA/YrhL